MVDEAQNILTSLLDVKDVSKFNDILLTLFTTIPRKMSNVKSYLADTQDDFSRIIQKEQDLLDVMKGQVVQKQIIDESSDKETQSENTILEHLGLVFEECSLDDIARIKAELGSCADKFDMAWKVTK